ERSAPIRLGGIFADFTVNVVSAFSLGVVRLQLAVRNRPGRRDSSEMFYLAKIFFAETKQRCAVKFRIAADIIIGVRMQLTAIGVAPQLLRVVATARIHLERTPVLFFAPDEWTALKQ